MNNTTENSPEIESNLQKIFEQSLYDQPPFSAQDLPMEWEVGQHKYFRVVDGQGVLDKKLREFRELGVRVLDFDRRWGFWVFKTMVPS